MYKTVLKEENDASKIEQAIRNITNINKLQTYIVISV